MAEETKEEKREIIGVPIEVFPDFTGERYPRSLYLGKDASGEPFNHKLTCNIPVPSTFQEVCEMFGLKEPDGLARLVAAVSTDRDTATRKYINEIKDSVNWDDPDDETLGKIGTMYEKDLATAPERKVSEKAKEAKEAKAFKGQTQTILEKYGVANLEELDAKLSKLAKSKK